MLQINPQGVSNVNALVKMTFAQNIIDHGVYKTVGQKIRDDFKREIETSDRNRAMYDYAFRKAFARINYFIGKESTPFWFDFKNALVRDTEIKTAEYITPTTRRDCYTAVKKWLIEEYRGRLLTNQSGEVHTLVKPSAVLAFVNQWQADRAARITKNKNYSHVYDLVNETLKNVQKHVDLTTCKTAADVRAALQKLNHIYKAVNSRKYDLTKNRVAFCDNGKINGARIAVHTAEINLTKIARLFTIDQNGNEKTNVSIRHTDTIMIAHICGKPYLLVNRTITAADYITAELTAYIRSLKNHAAEINAATATVTTATDDDNATANVFETTTDNAEIIAQLDRETVNVIDNYIRAAVQNGEMRESTAAAVKTVFMFAALGYTQRETADRLNVTESRITAIKKRYAGAFHSFLRERIKTADRIEK